MHEFSLTSALIDLARQHMPPRSILRRVVIEAGPLQGIDPEAMKWAWQAATDPTDLAGAQIEVKQLPWDLHCPQCDARFTADELYAACKCGCDRCHPVGGNDLRLRSLVVDQLEEGEEQSDAGSGSRERAEAER